MFQKQWDFLSKSFELGKLPHALLFFGQEKIGKKDFALKFINSVLKENPGHPDFIFLDSQKEIQIAEIRNLIEKLSFKPYSSPQKFALINNVHLMGKEAQNCFLKFLEEPTDKTHIILITQYPDILLPTILSRVQKIRFYPSKGFKIEQDEKIISELLRISKSDLADRFKFAKDLSESDPSQVLDSWLRYFREELISENYSSKNKTSAIIKEIQKTKLLLSTTNANSRLALEILLMKI